MQLADTIRDTRVFSWQDRYERSTNRINWHSGQNGVKRTFAYFLYSAPSHLQTTPPHQTPSPSTPYRHIPPHTYSPAPKGVVKYDTPPLFSKKNYPLSTISHISLDISSLCLYNI